MKENENLKSCRMTENNLRYIKRLKFVRAEKCP